METFIENIKKELGSNLLLVGEYSRRKRNYVIVLETLNYTILQGVKPYIEKFYKKTGIYPLLLTKREVLNGVDVFPLDFLNLKNTVTVLYGEDVFKNLKVDKKHVRHSLEFEVRSKLMNLRRVILQIHSKKEIELVLKNAVPTLLPLFNGMLYLKGKSKIATVNGLLDELNELYKFDFRVLKPFNQANVVCTDENIDTLNTFLSELAKFIDKI